eukprot:gene4348-4619_t
MPLCGWSTARMSRQGPFRGGPSPSPSPVSLRLRPALLRSTAVTFVEVPDARAGSGHPAMWPVVVWRSAMHWAPPLDLTAAAVPGCVPHPPAVRLAQLRNPLALPSARAVPVLTVPPASPAADLPTVHPSPHPTAHVQPYAWIDFDGATNQLYAYVSQTPERPARPNIQSIHVNHESPSFMRGEMLVALTEHMLPF